MNIETLKNQLPDYAKDLKLNLGSVLTSSSLSEAEAWGSALAAALVSKHGPTIAALSAECASRMSPAEIDGAAAAAAIMSMNNVWYKLAGLHEDPELKRMPARLRMQVIGSHGGVGQRLFETFSLSASVVNACPNCVVSHTAALREAGMTAQNIADIGRIAAVVKAVSDTLAFDAHLVRPVALA